MKEFLYKNLFAFIFFTCQQSAIAQPTNNPSIKKITDSITISLSGNSYAYPGVGNDASKFISETGISGWNDANVYFKVFFHTKQKGSIQVSIKAKSAINNSHLQVQLHGSSKSSDIIITKSSDFITIPVGSFEIKDTGYEYIQLTTINKTSTNFPDIESIIVSGSSAQNITCNTSEYRGAPATHLWYPIPKDSSISWFYSEIKVPVGVDAVNAYYMTNGFDGGYMGIQANSPTERRFIFSIWSNYNTDNPKEIPAEYAVRLIKKGKDVYADDFGNEGSGGHSHLIFNWKNGETYKLLVGAKSNGGHTIFTGYYYAPENKQWKLIAQWDKAKNEGKLLSGLYSFVENFGPNGKDYFKALYGNQWVCTTSGKWIELSKAHFTTTASQLKHPVFDYGVGTENNWFYMYSGGFKQVSNINPHDMIERKPEGKVPEINFSFYLINNS